MTMEKQLSCKSSDDMLKWAQNEELKRRLKRYLEQRKTDDKCIKDEWLLYVCDNNPIRHYFIIFLCIAFVLFGIFCAGWIVKVLFFDDISDAKCLIEYNFKEAPLGRDLLNPRQNCAICQKVRKIPKVHGISQVEFEQKYAYTKRPVVVTDAAKNWSAIDHFSFAFLKEVFKGPALEAVAELCQFFPYKSDFGSLRDVFEMPPSRAYRVPNTKPWYVGWSNCHMKAAEQLRKHYGRPYFLPQYSEASKMDWIFMGSPGYGANMHIDDVKLPSWQAQLKGKKLWTLQPPYECRLECPNPLKVVVNPGDIIVLDTNYWYHGTEILGDDTSIVIGTEFD